MHIRVRKASWVRGTGQENPPKSKNDEHRMHAFVKCGVCSYRIFCRLFLIFFLCRVLFFSAYCMRYRLVSCYCRCSWVPKKKVVRWREVVLWLGRKGVTRDYAQESLARRLMFRWDIEAVKWYSSVSIWSDGHYCELSSIVPARGNYINHVLGWKGLVHVIIFLSGRFDWQASSSIPSPLISQTPMFSIR